MRVNKYLLPALVLVALLGAVVVASATGNWIVSGKDMIDVEAMTSSADIRGWMTLEQVAGGFGLTQEELYGLLEIPAEVAFDTALKDMEGIVEVSEVREVIAARIGETSALSESDADVEAPTPEAKPTAAPEPTRQPVAEATATHVPQGTGTGDGTGTGPTPLPEGETLAGADIKGSYTLQQIVDQAHVPADALLKALNLPADSNLNIAVKDLVNGGNVAEVTDVRDAVTKLQGQ